MRFLLGLFFLCLSTLEAKNLFFEDMETYLKTNDYAEYTFDFKKTGLFLNQEGKGTLLIKKSGDFLVEVPFAKDSKYIVKYENEMFFELIALGKKHTYTVYSDPANLQIGFILEALKKFPSGVTSSLATLNKLFNVKITHDEAQIKAKLDHETLQSLSIKRVENKTQLTFIIKPEQDSKRTESIEMTTFRSEKAPTDAAFKFILDIPNEATVALVE